MSSLIVHLLVWEVQMKYYRYYLVNMDINPKEITLTNNYGTPISLKMFIHETKKSSFSAFMSSLEIPTV